MKRNPWVIFVSIATLGMVLILAAFGAAMYTAFGDKTPSVSGDSVLVLEVKGVILDSKNFVKQLQKYRENKHVKAVVIRLDTPGGVVGPTQEMYDEIMRTRQMGLHVVASMGSVAASGGYYTAVACEKIITNPGTITGSIGVIMEFANLSGLYNWAKVDRYVVKSGPFKDIGSETRPMSPAEKEIIQGMIDGVYMQFKKAVAKGRNLKLEQLEHIADGRILNGEQAVKLGLADGLGGLHEAVELAAKLGGIKGKPEIFTPATPRKRIWDLIFGGEEEDEEATLQKFAKRMTGMDLVGKPLFMMPGSW